MNLIEAKDYKHASVLTANYLAAQVLLKPDSVLGLATGSTPIGTYEELVEQQKLGNLSFAQVTTVNLDEYVGLPIENEQSYHYFMHDHLINHIDIDSANTHLPNGLAKDMEASAKNYDELIESLGGIDLQLLGIGVNGHIGFNEPGEIHDGTHVIELTDTTIEANKRFFASKEEVPTKAITMGIGTILRARKIVMIVTGTNKSETLKDTLCGPITPMVPASLLRLHGDCTIIADADARSLL